MQPGLVAGIWFEKILEKLYLLTLKTVAFHAVLIPVEKTSQNHTE